MKIVPDIAKSFLVKRSTKLFLNIILLISIACVAKASLQEVDFDKSMGISFIKKIYNNAIGDAQYKIIKKIKHNYERNINLEPAELNKIPRIIHHIWLKKTPLTEQTKYFIQTCKKNNPNYEFKLWTIDDLDAIPSFTSNSKDSETLLSYEILKQYGGIYLGNEVECFAPFDKLLSRYSIFAGIASQDYNFKFPATILASSTRNKIISKTIENIQKNNSKKQDYQKMLFDNLIEAIPSTKDLMIFPAGYFYPTYKKNIILEPMEDKYLVPILKKETIAIDYFYGKSLVDYRSFNYELVNENSTKKFLYWPHYGNKPANIIFNEIYNQNFPSQIDFSSQAKIPLQFQILCYDHCDKFWSDNMDLVKINSNFSFNLWSSSDIQNAFNQNNDLFNKADNEQTRNLLLALFIINKEGGIFVDDKLTPVSPMDELAYKYDFFGAIPELENISDDIMIHLDAIGAAPENIIIKKFHSTS